MKLWAFTKLWELAVNLRAPEPVIDALETRMIAAMDLGTRARIATVRRVAREAAEQWDCLVGDAAEPLSEDVGREHADAVDLFDPELWRDSDRKRPEWMA